MRYEGQLNDGGLEEREEKREKGKPFFWWRGGRAGEGASSPLKKVHTSQRPLLCKIALADCHFDDNLKRQRASKE